MKKIAMLTALLCFQLLATAQAPDEEAIKKVIRTETESYYGRNIEAWKGTWRHSADTRRTFVSKYGYHTEEGWDTALAQVQAQFKESPDPQNVTIATKNFSIVQKGDMAAVDYDQVLTGPTISDSSGEGRSHETRILVKEDNQWKIISQMTNWPSSYDYSNPQAVEMDLNFTGYNLIAAKKLPEAIEVFKLNVKLFPGAWNTYDSLGEAYALAGDKKKAIEQYEKSIKLNPRNDTGAAALAKLKQK